MILHSLFPTPVGFFKMEPEITPDELDFIQNLELRPNQNNMTSKDNHLFDHPELSRIVDFCNVSLQEYFQSVYAPKYDVSPYITQSWSNYTTKGQSHHKHEHPNSVISGVLYIQAIKNSDRIHFFKPGGYQQLKLPTENFNVHNSDSWWLGVEHSQLLLFPSSLTHQVNVIQTEGTRISISFNTFLKGYLGEEHELTGLYLKDQS